VLPRDDSQQNAELRQAFLKTLPRRIELIQRRGQRLIRGAWDINVLGVLNQEVQALAGAAGRYGLVETSERLYQLELSLLPLLREPQAPSAEQKGELSVLCDRLNMAQAPEPMGVASASRLIIPLAMIDAQFPRASFVPDGFWRRFDVREIAVLTSESPGCGNAPASNLVVAPVRAAEEMRLTQAQSMAEFADKEISAAAGRNAPPLATRPAEPDLFAELLAQQPQLTSVKAPALADPPSANSPQLEAAPVAAGHDAHSAPESKPPRTNRAFMLTPSGALTRELSAKLMGQGMEVDRFEQRDELQDAMQSLQADLVVVDGLLAGLLDSFVEAAREIEKQTGHRTVLAAVVPANDLQMRVRAMRSGYEVVVPSSLPIPDIVAKILTAVGHGDPLDFKIMIVEDDRSQAMFAESVLRKAGMETLAVTNPLETLSELERFKPDLILMDLYMPNLDGMELTAIIRERDAFVATPIVFLSGEQDSDKHFEAISAGGDDFLSKPIRPKHLISAVTNRARRARALQRQRANLQRTQGEGGLYERAFVFDRIAEHLTLDTPTGVVAFVEVDGATSLREQLGIAGLDALMIQIGRTLGALLGPNHLAARYGDASLLVFLPGEDPEKVLQLAHRWRIAVSATLFEVASKVIPAALSAGLCAFCVEFPDPASLIAAAERALVQARQPQSRERVKIYAAETKSMSEEDRVLDALRRAIRQEDFQLLFQPIVALNATGQEQYEVLLRLRLDDGRVVAAREFVPVAARHGLLADVDRLCLSRALSIIDERRRQGRGLRLFVQQSGATLQDVQRVTWLKQSLETRKIPADAIALVFDLSDAMANLKAAMPFFQQARALGVHLVLDSFESNMTALQLLSYLPVNYVKLAHKYLTGGPGNGQSEELRAIIRAAHEGQRSVIASQVENAQAAAALWSVGVDLIQGNFVQQAGVELGFDFSASAL